MLDLRLVDRTVRTSNAPAVSSGQGALLLPQVCLAMLVQVGRVQRSRGGPAFAESEEAPAEAPLLWLSTGTLVPADRGCCSFPLRRRILDANGRQLTDPSRVLLYGRSDADSQS